MADDVDIADVTRSFSDQEWGSLSSESQQHVHKERNQKRCRPDQGSPREVAATAAPEQATAVMANVTFEKPPENNNGGAERAAGFGRGACHGRGRAGR
jgi:predicted metal-dependent hydrolase